MGRRGGCSQRTDVDAREGRVGVAGLGAPGAAPGRAGVAAAATGAAAVGGRLEIDLVVFRSSLDWFSLQQRY